MLIKRVSSLFLSAMILILLYSCSGSTPAGKTQASINNGANKLKDKPVISIEYLNIDRDINKALMMYQYENTDVFIKYNEVDLDYSKVDAFSNKLLLDLNTGVGPDVIIFENILFKSMYKATSSGVFCDLNRFFKEDKEFAFADYYQNIIDVGLINGSRYFMPLRAESQFFYTTKSILEKNNININYKNWTWKDLLKITEDYSSKKDKTARYIYNYSLTFIDMVNTFNKSFIDFDKRNSNFNNDELKEALQICKKLYKLGPGIRLDAGDDDIYTKGLDDNYFVLNDNLGGNISDILGLLQLNTELKDKLGDELLIIPLPSWYGDGFVYSSPRYLYGINNKCKNKEYAYKLLKYLISADFQSTKDYNSINFNFSKGYTISKKALSKDFVTLSPEGIQNNFRLNKPFSEEFNAAFKFMVENSNARFYYDERIKNIITKAADNYFRGQISEGEALKRMDDQIELFLNE